ncbi:prepilin-type N-terminal cleavage/methylation domain-containing protein, partial [Neisseria dentiae]
MRSKYQGFTLTELLIVIAIVAIMAAIAFPNMSQWIASRR